MKRKILIHTAMLRHRAANLFTAPNTSITATKSYFTVPKGLLSTASKSFFFALGAFFSTLTALFSLSACSGQAQFHVEGHIEGAQDSMLYLEALTLTRGVEQLDSVKLGSDGSFSLAGSDTTSCPEFYRLRIAGQVINLSIDSTETVTVDAKWPDMAFNYSVKGSGNCDTIRILSQRLANLERRVVAMADDRRYTMEERSNNIAAMVKAYKDTVKIEFIQNRYERASSYYALFQMVGSMNVFDTEADASDVQWVNAVANAWCMYYPGCQRTEHLYNLALRGRKNTHRRTIELNLDDEKVKETGIIDMGFPDLSGKERRLSQLKGQVVLLDFTAYSSENSQERIMLMRDIYNKYHARGLEIYQVSVDPDEHFWKTACASLPWVCVWCAEGMASDMITLYQVQQLGTYFLIDRDNNLVDRAENIPNLEQAIEKLL